MDSQSRFSTMQRRTKSGASAVERERRCALRLCRLRPRADETTTGLSDLADKCAPLARCRPRRHWRGAHSLHRPSHDRKPSGRQFGPVVRTTAPVRPDRWSVNKSDSINVFFVIIACIAGHVAPVATLLGSYAILGPAHYLTEVSWLHDRHYFLSRHLSWCVIALMVLTFAFLVAGSGASSVTSLMCALSLAVAAAFGLSLPMIILVAVVSSGAAFLASRAHVAIILGLAILVPTIVHVFGFTAAFVVRGARKSGRRGWLTPCALAIAVSSFALIPSATLVPTPWLQQAQATFGKSTSYLLFLPGRPSLSNIVGFFGFAYAFHYLNWFGKTSVTGWHKIGCGRGALLIAVWVVISVAYLQGIQFGLAMSLPLSVGHVFLEFPLNALTIRSLVRRTSAQVNVPA